MHYLYISVEWMNATHDMLGGSKDGGITRVLKNYFHYSLCFFKYSTLNLITWDLNL